MTDHLLSHEQRNQLEQILARTRSPRLRRLAEILLLYDGGRPTREVALAVGLSRGSVRRWRRRYLREGPDLFSESRPDDTQASTSAPPELTETEGAEAPVPANIPSGATPTSIADFITAASNLKRPGVEPGDPLDEAGRKVLRYHFAQMLLHEAGTRLGEDIEELHDMRVATRRMRAAFEVFDSAFTAKSLKLHLKGLRATGRALGKVRDLDVFMEKARNYSHTLPEENQAGLEPLLNSWEQDREIARIGMIAYLDSQRYETFKEKFFEFVITPGLGSRTNSGSQPTPNLVRQILPILIYTRMASVRAFDSILEKASLDQLHALRIEFKKLRYTLEFFREVLGAESKTIINEIKKLQDHLGDLNDAQVATQLLREFLTQWDEQQASLPVSQRLAPEPVLSYMLHRYNELHTLMSNFPEAWEQFNRPELGQNLAQAVAGL